eukprot:EG_transcript_14847
MPPPVWGLRLFVATVFAVLLVVRSVRKKSLSLSGAAAAFLVGCLSVAAGPRFTAVLLTFFVTCSALTKQGKERKRRVEEDYELSSCRNWHQVFCNGFTGTAVCAYLLYLHWQAAPLSPRLRDALTGVFLGHYACCTADTWASEVGILATAPPVHVLTLRRVPAGTNGGVTGLGLAASVAGAAVLGLAHWLACAATAGAAPASALGQAVLTPALVDAGPWMGSWASIPLTALLGLFGSLLDSVLGAVLQYSGAIPGTERVVNGPRAGAKHICGRDVVSNNTVNLLSSAATAALGGLLGYCLP